MLFLMWHRPEGLEGPGILPFYSFPCWQGQAQLSPKAQERRNGGTEEVSWAKMNMQVPSGEWDCLNQTSSPKFLFSLLKEPNELGGLVVQDQMWAGPALFVGGWIHPEQGPL